MKDNTVKSKHIDAKRVQGFEGEKYGLFLIGK